MLFHDSAQAEVSGDQEHADHGQGQRKLVTDHLRGTAQPAEKGVLAVGGPTGQRDAVYA